MSRIIFTALLALTLIASPIQAATDWVATAAKVRPSIARIQGTWEGKTETVCTTFSINEAKNYFLTANHCDLRESFINGDGDTTTGTDDHKIWVEGHEAFPIYQNPDLDIMVMVVPDLDEPALHLTHEVSTAEPVMSYGWGFGLDLPIIRIANVAIPSAEFPQVFENFHYGSKDATYTLYDAPFIHGQSGGPILNTAGEVVSVCQANIPDSVGISVTVSELQVSIGKYLEKP